MKQLVQNARTGEVDIEELPDPALRVGGVLVQTAVSVVSAGTERSMLAFAGKSLIGKALERPDLARQVWDKLRNEGLSATYSAVASRLDAPIPLGYSSAGTVIAAGGNAGGLRVGDRIACAGAGYAVHAELAYVPRNLCVRIPTRPDGTPVPFDEAAFAALGAVALQGVRLVQPTLGERVVVLGLGAIGQLAVQLLRAHGCGVLALDQDSGRVALAGELGAEVALVAGKELPMAEIMAFTRGRGADAVVIAAATDSNEPVELAGEISRRKGRVVVVGSVRMDVPRRNFYERELTLTVSSSYGPGRYDPAYEEGGTDYPLAYVRWTEQRNMEAFLDMLASGRIRVAPLITHRIPFAEAERAYALIGPRTAEPSLGIVLRYGSAMEQPLQALKTVSVRAPAVSGDQTTIAAVGAGLFARSVIFPALRRMPGVRLRTVTTSTGLTAKRCASRFGFELASTDSAAAIEDPDVQAVFVLTPHRLHARLTTTALKAGRHVFVEKPLCVNENELGELTRLYRTLSGGASPAPVLCVGFNRRFSPLAERLREETHGVGPLVMNYRVNAGAIPASHWIHENGQGGRIVGEACHFIDLGVYLTGALPKRVYASGLAGTPEPTSLTVDFADGSVLSLHYIVTGSRRLSKERLEVFGGGRSWVLEDWHTLESYTGKGRRFRRQWGQAKGYREELAAFFTALRSGGPVPIPFEQIVASTQATFCAVNSHLRGAPVDIVLP